MSADFSGDRDPDAGTDPRFEPLSAAREASHDPTDRWLDRFFEAFYRHRPVDGTFIGAHGHDGRLPDWSARGLSDSVTEMRALLDEPRPEVHEPALGEGAAASADRIRGLDRRIAEGFLRIQLWEHESGHRYDNPSVHVGEAIFGLMSLLLPASAPAEGALASLGARMADIPRFLRAAEERIETAPTAWTRRAMGETRGALAFFDEGLDRAEIEIDSASVRAEAREAFAGFGRFLEDDLLARPADRLACGPEAFDLHLRQGHFLDRTADEIVEYAREELASCQAWIEASTRRFDARAPGDVLARLADGHPSPATYEQRHGETWREMKHIADERKLLTWPDFPIRYTPRPAWARAAAPDLYFLFYRSPAAYGRPEVHDYMIAPLPEDDASNEEVEAFLRANHDSVIKLNHVIHHGGIGHHVQNWHAFRAPSRVGRVAAVDGASRIAMFCGGTMAEGWACYATDLMAEAGGLSSLEVHAERQGRVRMCARAIVDVELHHGRMSLAEAERFYSGVAGMSERAAHAEAVKNSMFPGAALMYLVGTDLIHDLRIDMVGRLGADFELHAFHDAFLSYGSIPVKLIADEMKARASAGLALGADA